MQACSLGKKGGVCRRLVSRLAFAAFLFAPLTPLYSQDITAPSAVAGLFASSASAAGTLELSWAAPGDDGGGGTLLTGSSYYVQYATYTGVSWSYGAAQINISTSGVEPGTMQYWTVPGLLANTSYYFRLWTKDDAGNPSALSNLAEALTLIEAPTSVYFEEVTTYSVTASAYAANFTGIDRPGTGVNITTGAAYGAWNSGGNYWTSKAAMPTTRYDLAAGVIGGKLYAVGGTAPGQGDYSTNEEYDPATNSWTTKAAMPTARYRLAAAATGGKLYAAGGMNEVGAVLNQNEEYDPAANSWATKAAMPTARYLLAAGAVGGKLYAVGGHNGSTLLNLNEEYDPAVNSWTTKAAMPTARVGPVAVAAGGKLYAVGGIVAGSGVTQNEEYNPATNSWAAKAAMPTGRAYLSAGVIGGKLYAVGGYGVGFYSQNEAYDPAANSWVTKTAMPAERGSFAAGVIGGKLYAVGGYTGLDTVNLNAEYTPGLAKTFSGLKPNTLYGFRAKARNQAGAETGEATGISTYTLAAVSLPVSGPVFTNAAPASITVNWSSGTAAGGYNGPGASYKIQVSTASNFSGVYYASTTYNLSLTTSGLSANTTYYFRAQANNTAGVTDYSWLVLGSTVAVDLVSPGALSGLAASSASYVGALTLSWNATGNDGAARTLASGSSFYVQYSTYSGVSWSTASAQVVQSTSGVAPSALVRYNIGALDPGTTYYLAVWHKDEAGNLSGISNIASAYARPFPSLTINKTVTGDGTWHIYFGTGVGYGFTGLTMDATGNTYVAGKMSGGGNHDLFVHKYSPSGDLLLAKYFNGEENLNDAGHAHVAVDTVTGSFYLAGSERKTAPADVLLLIKYSADGQVLWLRRAQGNSSTTGQGMYSVKLDPSGNVYIGGQNSNGATVDSCVKKYSPAGDALWSSTKSFTGANEEVMDLAIQGGYIYASGAADMSGSGQGQNGTLWKLDINTGLTQWTTTYNGAANRHDELQGIVADASGDIYIVGDEQVALNDYAQMAQKRNSSGVIQWRALNNFFAGTSDVDQDVRVVLSTDNYLYSSGLVLNAAKGYDAAISKRDLNGNLLGVYTYDLAGGTDHAMNLALNGDKLVFVGDEETGGQIRYFVRKINVSDVKFPLPAGCAQGFNVKKDGTGGFTTIQGAVNALPRVLNADTCVVVRDTQTYSEQVTVQGFTNNGYRLKIIADPTFISSAPAINPPVSSTAAFHIMNDSVTVQGINIISTNTVAYGIRSSSGSLNFSRGNIISGGKIWASGIWISSYSAVSYSSVTVQTYYGLKITGSNNEISFSTLTTNSTHYALYINGGDSNILSHSYLFSATGDGARLDSGADGNTISDSTITSTSGGRYAIYMTLSSSNTIARSYISNPAGHGAYLTSWADYNTISDSTMTGSSSNYPLLIANADHNLVTRSLMTNSGGYSAYLVTGSHHNTISDSVLVSSTSTTALLLLNTWSNLITRSNISNPTGYGVQMISSANYNTVSFTTITVNSTYMGLNIDSSTSNIITRTYISNPSGHGAFLGYGADKNTISSSTVLSNAANYFAVKLVNSASNTVTQSYISNPPGVALTSVFGGGNLISYSTITSAAWAYSSVFMDASDYNTIQNSLIRGANGLFIRDSTGTFVSYNVIAATNTAGTGLRIDTSRNTSTAGNGISAPGTGILLNAGNSGTINLASDIVSGAPYGLSIDAQAAGAALAVSGLNFSSLPPNTTAINFLGGTFVSTFTGISFNDTDIGVNVYGALLGAGSRITMRDSSGPREGQSYENDPAGVVDWGAAAGCEFEKTVKKAGGGDCTTIQACIDMIPASLAGNWCVDIQDSAAYQELPVIRNRATNGFRIILGALDAANRPSVHSNGLDTDAIIKIANSSVTVRNLIVNQPIGYNGILVSSPNALVDQVFVDYAGQGGFGPGQINAAISISSWTTLTRSSISVNSDNGVYGCAGLKITGTGSAVSSLTVVGSGMDFGNAVWLYDASSNTITQSYISNAYCYGLTFGSNGGPAAHYNTVSYSTITSGNANGGCSGLHIAAGSYNNINRSYISNSNGRGVLSDTIDGPNSFTAIDRSTIAAAGAYGIALDMYESYSFTVSRSLLASSAAEAFNMNGGSAVITESTMTSQADGLSAIYLFNPVDAAITKSYVQGSSAVFVSGGSAVTISSSVLSGTGASAKGISLLNYANAGLDTVTIKGGPLLWDGNSTVNLSSVTFQGLQAGATAIDLVANAAYNATFYDVNFADPDIAVNINGSLVDAAFTGSQITMQDSYGPRTGTPYENDPAAFIEWLPDMDFTPPSAAILQPVNNSYLNSLALLTGTAADDVLVSSVQVGIMRLSDSYYWNGAAWAASQTWPDASVSEPSWSYSALPVWQNGSSYRITARAMDSSANWSVIYSTSVFYYDTGIPVSAITAPSSSAVLSSFSGIAGTAWDTESFANQAEVRIRRNSDGYYWDGDSSLWGAAEVWNLAVGSVTWSYTGLTEASLTNGTTYYAVSRTSDTAGNLQTSEINGSTFIYSGAFGDVQPPVAAIISPLNSSNLTALSSITGTAGDNVVVSSVALSILREDTGLFWDGTQWSAGRAWLSASLFPSSWTYSNIPALVSGSSYTAAAKARDTAGNWSVIYSTSLFSYYIPPSAPSLSASAAGVSSITWTWNDVLYETGYRVLDSTGANISGNLAQGAVSWAEEGLSLNASYTRRIEAFNASGSSSSVSLTRYTLASAPSSAAFTGVAYSSMVFGWSGGANPGPTNYQYDISLSSSFGVILASGTQTSFTVQLTGLAEGTTCYARARAVNGDGIATSYDFAAPAVTLVYHEVVPPSVAILQPVNYSYRNSLVALTGTAADNVSVSSVQAGLMRLSDGYYWDGSAWAASQSWLDASVSTPAWSYSAMPAWVNGAAYRFTARARDNSGNWSAVYSTSVFYFDSGLPASAVTVPASGATIPAFSGLSGTAWDAESFTAQIWVGIKRASDEQYWNGAISQWTSAQAWNLAVGSATWSYAGLPEGALTSGTTYFAVSRAADLAGNVQISETLVSTFTYLPPPPPELNPLPFTGVAVTSLTVNWESTYSTGTVYYVRLSTLPDAALSVFAATAAAASQTLYGLTPNTTYFGYVSTAAASNYLLADAEATLAMAPSSLTAAGVAYSSMGFTWSGGANPAHTLYDFQVSLSSSFAAILSSAVYSSGPVWQTGLAEGTTYFARIRALNSALLPTAYVYSGPVVTLAHTSPAAGTVSGILGTVLGSTSVYWTWNAGSLTHADSYGVFSSSGGFLASVAFSTSGASYTQTGLLANTPVSVKIAGYGSEGYAQLAQSATYYTSAAAPGSPGISARMDISITLGWEANGNPLGTVYQLWLDADAAFSQPSISTMTVSSHTASGLQPGTQYFFKARAMNGDGIFSDFSAAVSTITMPLLPVQPAAPSGSALGVSSITWSWAAVSGATGYRVYAATAQSTLLASPSVPAYVQEGLSPNTTYSIVAAGINASGEGTVSPSAVPVATLAKPPSGAAVSAVYATSATLTWGLNGNPAGTTAKVLRVNTATTFTTAGLSMTDTGLLGCTSYYFRLWNLNRSNTPTEYIELGPAFTGSPSPLPPGNLSAASLSGYRIALSWEPAPFEGITGYNLYYDNGSGVINYGTPLASLSALQTSYTTGMLSSVSYKFGLRAVHRCGVEEKNTSVLASATGLYSLTGVRAAIKIPQSGKKVNGNSVTVMAELVTGTVAETRNVRLQYKASSSSTWLEIPAKDPGQHPNPAFTSPYFIHWDVSGLAGGSYDLRAIATDLGNVSDPSPAAVTIAVAAAEADITENVTAGKATKEQKVNNLVVNTLQAADPVTTQVTKLEIPAGALNASTATVSVTNNPAVVPPAPPDAEPAGIVTEVTLSNQSLLAGGQTAAVTLLFPDADNDGIVDGTTLRASQLEMYSAHSAAGPWQRDLASVVDLAGKKVTGHTTHFSFFALFAPQAVNINQARAYPVPWRPGSGGRFDSAPGTDGITFENLTDKTEIKIYTVAGRLVRELKLTAADLGVKVWDGKNSAGVKAASGVYLAHIKSGSAVKVLKIAVER